MLINCAIFSQHTQNFSAEGSPPGEPTPGVQRHCAPKEDLGRFFLPCACAQHPVGATAFRSLPDIAGRCVRLRTVRMGWTWALEFDARAGLPSKQAIKRMTFPW